MFGKAEWCEPVPKLRAPADCGPKFQHQTMRNHMVAMKIQLPDGIVRAVIALLLLGAGWHGIRVSASESSKTPEPAPLKRATQVASSTAGESSPVWIATDFAAIALMGLGAIIVFLPLPRIRSRKASISVADPVEEIPPPGIAVPPQPLGEALSSPRRVVASSAKSAPCQESVAS